MARNQRLIPAPPERVFAVLSDPASYADWVVGSDIIRDADAGWPAVGTRFPHRAGGGPWKVTPPAEVAPAVPPRRLELHAKARPLGPASVVLELEPQDGG